MTDAFARVVDKTRKYRMCQIVKVTKTRKDYKIFANNNSAGAGTNVARNSQFDSIKQRGETNKLLVCVQGKV